MGGTDCLVFACCVTLWFVLLPFCAAVGAIPALLITPFLPLFLSLSLCFLIIYQSLPSATRKHKHYAHSPLITSLLSAPLSCCACPSSHTVLSTLRLTLGLLTLYLLIEIENPEANSFCLVLAFKSFI